MKPCWQGSYPVSATFTLCLILKCPQFSTYAYDAVKSLALALNGTLSNASGSNSTTLTNYSSALIEELSHVKFSGASVRVWKLYKMHANIIHGLILSLFLALYIEDGDV